MKIRITTGDELNTLLDALAREIVDANIYHRLFSSIVSSIDSYEREFCQSNTFWSLAINALADARIIRLCRVYDQETSSLNLVNLLDTIKANLYLFEKEHFQDRLKSNPFVDSLAQTYRIPSAEELERDIEYASDKNPSVKKLMKWRHNVIAHRGAKVSLGKSTVLLENPLSQNELEDLLDNGFEIFNRYSSLYRASTYSQQMLGQDDYKSLLKFIRLGLDKWDEDISKEDNT